MKTICQIKIVDPYSVNSFHGEFNAAFFAVCSQITNDLSYVVSRSSWKNIRNILQQNNRTSTKNITTYRSPEGESKFWAFCRTLLGAVISLYYYITLKRDTILIYSYTNQLSFCPILLLNKLLNKKIAFVLHGDLEMQLHQVPIKNISWFYRLFHRIGMKYLIQDTSSQLLVLGDSIKNNLIKIFPQLKNNVISICHPYFHKPIQTLSHETKHQKLIIGTVGIMTKQKGVDDLISIANNFKEHIKKGDIEFRIIGTVANDIDRKQLSHIKYTEGNERLSIADFQFGIKQLDYVLYLYPTNSYLLTASGAILDAVKYDKPIITYPNPYFEYLLKDSDAGYIINNTTEAIRLIDRLLKNPADRHYHTDNRATIRRISIPDNAESLSRQLKQKFL